MGDGDTVGGHPRATPPGLGEARHTFPLQKSLILQAWCYLMAEGRDERPLSAAGKGRAGAQLGLAAAIPPQRSAPVP